MSRRLVPDDLQLAREYQGGASLRELARRYGCSLRAIRNSLDRSGTSRRPMGRVTDLSAEQIAEIVKAYDDGCGESQRAIGERLGVHQSTVSALLRRAGVPCPRRSGAKPREEHPSWKGGRFVNPEGYVLVRPTAEDLQYATLNSTGYVVEHRLVMGRALGRRLLRTETVHHINGDKADNRPENLQLRQGPHGAGVALRCRACGSHDIAEVMLEE